MYYLAILVALFLLYRFAWTLYGCYLDWKMFKDLEKLEALRLKTELFVLFLAFYQREVERRKSAEKPPSGHIVG